MSVRNWPCRVQRTGELQEKFKENFIYIAPLKMTSFDADLKNILLVYLYLYIKNTFLLEFTNFHFLLLPCVVQ